MMFFDFINKIPPGSFPKISHILLSYFDGSQFLHGLLRTDVGSAYMEDYCIKKSKGMPHHQTLYLLIEVLTPT